ncbi:MAG: 4Fe-4S binding protein [Candidatus Shapirobacteria bacterium]|nr:4Fe-4S binding protein [Candidatus Shapirobacteria bacterium]MDD3002270.1 4Fe-4S binding protein [Candidatus Shapirobacteria bacterium]MDD4382725.1 4Fe-4S binding protein [Candidatus Shapirobacteria bacterium]
MPAIINFKICDNSDECSGLSICPTQALIWNNNKKTLEIDELKCINCGSCAKACPVRAIKVATDKDFEFIKKEYEKDKRKTSDLFIERFGSQSTDKSSLISYAYFQSITNKKEPMVIELFNNDSIMCLIKSIPIRELFKKGVLYNKIDTESDQTLINQYKVKELPCLLFFENGQFKDKIEGYFDTTQKEKLLEKVKKIGF